MLPIKSAYVCDERNFIQVGFWDFFSLFLFGWAFLFWFGFGLLCCLVFLDKHYFPQRHYL